MGDSIEEVNEKSEVSDYLFQGDIVMTEYVLFSMQDRFILFAQSVCARACV